MAKGTLQLKPKVFAKLLAKKQAFTDAEALSLICLDIRTINRLKEGLPVHSSTLKKAFARLGIQDLSPYLQTEAEPQLDEWVEETVLQDTVVAENGLEYKVSQMRHTVLPGEWARGKCYRIAAMSSADQVASRELLVRHSRVCHKVHSRPDVWHKVRSCDDVVREVSCHRHIAVNLSCPPSRDNETWWIIDQWVAGKTLAEWLETGPLPVDMLRSVVEQTALGLDALHEAEVVCRHLNPQSILLREADRSAVLTDFELGKLRDDSLTVKPSGGFRQSPYLAPEVKDDADRRADLYSWGRVFLHAALGELPKPGQEKKAKPPRRVPPEVWDLVLSCCSPSRKNRPTSVEDVLEVIQTWE